MLPQLQARCKPQPLEFFEALPTLSASSTFNR